MSIKIRNNRIEYDCYYHGAQRSIVLQSLDGQDLTNNNGSTSFNNFAKKILEQQRVNIANKLAKMLG